jgi:hypothetical protein
MASVQTKPLTGPPSETLEETFQRLANVWQKAVAHLSSSNKRESHPAYREIIALGPAAVPMMLRDLEINHRHWFAALTAVTGANPVAEEDAGKILKMIDVWLNWGKQKGYRW